MQQTHKNTAYEAQAGGDAMLHATAVAVAVDRDGPLAGVLLRGPSGSGKSDLALRLLSGCAWQRSRLVADDSVQLAVHERQIFARSPQAIVGLMEVRGLGIVQSFTCDTIRLLACCDLTTDVERLPPVTWTQPLGTASEPIRVHPLDPQQISAPMKIRCLLREILIGFSKPTKHDKDVAETEEQKSK